MRNLPQLPRRPSAGPVLALGASLLIAACGGGNGSSASGNAATPAEVASGVTVFELQAAALPADAAQQPAVPGFHLAPVVLDAPGELDTRDNAASASRAPRRTAIPSANRALATRRLTLDVIEAAAARGAAGPELRPDLAASAAVTYTPAQIRAAYALPTLPATGSTPSAAQAAQLGAGQTIYLIDANDDPNVAAELAAFNQSFGLPACTTKAIAVSASLPLAAASTSACQFSVVYATPSGTMSGTAPAYDSGWATEITLDVQWAHATAPLARLILIEAADSSLASLLGAVDLANAMGPGIVSMSFGASEGNWTSSVDSSFSAANMSYVAATGDSGAGVQWPAVSTHVLAVGGTSLTYGGSGNRSETAWADGGGGISQYTAAPSYQSSAVPGMGTQSLRNVADVSFNADPSTGQYLAVIPKGATAVNWLSAGGTSLATPQWAGVLAIANALRAQAAKPVLGAPHAALYGQIAQAPGNYASDIADITVGADGSCSSCAARVGYDDPTGIGSPNATSLLATLSGAAVPPAPPVVKPAQIHGVVGTALSFTVSVTDADPVGYALSGAPSGMAIASTGIVKWATPVAGTYAVTATATDTKTALTGQGLYTVVIAGPAPPAVASTTVTAQIGVALSYTVAVTAPDPVSFTLGGAPSGMTIVSGGVLSWPSPKAGSYPVTVTAKDGKTGLSGQGIVTVNVATPTPPAVAGGTVSGKRGVALTFPVSVSAADPVTVTLSGAPSGMTIGSGNVVSWPSPAAGTYSVTATATDSKTGLSGRGTYSVVIASNATGPTISAPAMTGVAGKALTGTISFADAGASGLSVQISGVPLGMTFAPSGASLLAQWADPVLGNYALTIQVVDSNGATATATVPITITAH